MAKISRSQKMLSEIELFLDGGKYQDARVLLTFLDDAPFDRESQLRLFLINVTLNGAGAYQDEIAQLSALCDISAFEKDLVEKIVALSSKSDDEQGQKIREPVDIDGQPLSRSDAFQALEPQRLGKTELPQDRDTQLSATKETHRSLAQQLSEKEDLLENRNAELQALGDHVTELTAQIAGLSRAKDHETSLLRQELKRKSDLLQAQESALTDIQDRFAAQARRFETEFRETRDILAAREAEIDRFKITADEPTHVTEQLRAMEDQLSETKNLLAAHDTELDSVRARVSTLIQEKTEWIADRDLAARKIEEVLGEQIGLAQIMLSSIAEMEVQMGEQVRLLELQLQEKQNQLRSNREELEELHRQVDLLNQLGAETEGARINAETLLYPNSSAAVEDLDTACSTGAHPADPAKSPEPINSASSGASKSNLPAFRSVSKMRQKQSWRIFLTRGETKTFPVTALPVAAASLLMLPIGYFLLGHARTVSPPDASARWPGVVDVIPSAEQGMLSLSAAELAAEDEGRGEADESRPGLVAERPRKTVVADKRKVNTGEGTELVAGYVTRRSVPLRDRPRYAATAKAEIGPGTRVSVLDSEGSWLRVKTHQSGAVGYVRKEYLVQPSSP